MKLLKPVILLLLISVIGTTLGFVSESYLKGEKSYKNKVGKNEKPNIIIILADDLGWGDIHGYDPKYSKIPTPNVDRLISEGMHFTDAHSPSSVCTPTRYGLLTGRYPWRTRLQTGVLRPYDPPLIKANRLTLPDLLKEKNYNTGLIGKWHLGWNWPRGMKENRIIFNKPIKGGPTTRGFEYYFGDDVPNYPPYTFIKNDRITIQPTTYFRGNKQLTVGTPGPMAPNWKFDKVMPTLVEKVKKYISDHANKKKPFFLELSMTIPHEPIAPMKRFRGKSGINATGDLIVEMDWAVGEVIKALDDKGIDNNTLVIYTSDNGHSPYTGLKAFRKAHHRVSGPFRGVKSNIWDGGHRIPFIVRWPGVVQPHSKSNQLICVTDIFATVADILNIGFPDDAGVDSKSFLPILKGKDKPTRQALVEYSVFGRFAIQKGSWKLILAPGSGGYKSNAFKDSAAILIKKGLPPIQLYNVKKDINENNNLQAKQPEKVKELYTLLKEFIRKGRSTPGASQHNDVKPYIWKDPILKPNFLKKK